MSFFTPVHFCIALFLISLILFLIVIFRIRSFRNSILSNYKWILIIMIVAFVSKFPLDSNYFFGLGYEDSYIYNSYARLLLYNKNFEIDPFLTQACCVGPLSNCQGFVTYSGHLIGFPSVIFLLFKLLGYSKYTICIFNFICSLFSILLIFLISKKIIPNKSFAFISSLLYAITPIMGVFHTSSLSETFSSTFLLLVFLLYLTEIDLKNKLENSDNFILWVSLLSSLLFTVLIKRENLIILLLPSITIILSSLEGKYQLKRYIYKLIPYFAMGLFIIFLYLSLIKVQEINRRENVDIGSFGFQFKFFFSLFPVFVRSFLSIEWFSIFTYLCLAGICLIILNFKRYPLFLYPVLLFFGYLFIYSVHYTSYYFIKTGQVSEFETLRYITNFFPFYCLISGFSLYKLNDFIFIKLPKKGHGLYGLFKIALVLCFGTLLIIHNRGLREEFFRIEQKNRISPVTTTLSVINSNSIVLTDEPLLFQIFGSEDLFVIDLYQIGKSISEEKIRNLINNFDVYYLKKSFHDNEIQVKRYQDSFKIIKKLKKSEIHLHNSGNIFKIYLLKN
jgi:hypothetical protein